ncbi:NUDIX domain-containing protein [Streptomyces werraensis]|uniref:NUDIX domain-containing protein n=1 Tax=Streptomyces werraensis TaxID=68284 RepID=UPI003420093F
MRIPGRAARVAVLDPAGSVFLFRYDNPEVGVYWAMPGGGMEPGESPREAAEREVREETGWTDLVIEDGVLCLWEHDFTRAGVPVRRHEHIHLAYAPAGNRPGTSRPRTRRTGSSGGAGGRRPNWRLIASRCGRRSCRNCWPGRGGRALRPPRSTSGSSRTGRSSGAGPSDATMVR